MEIQILPVVGMFEQRKFFTTDLSKILERSSSLKHCSKSVIQALWVFSSYNYEIDLKPYFEMEKKLLERNIKIQRIINPNSVKRDEVINHCNEFRTHLVQGKYELCLNKAEREFSIVDRTNIIIYAEGLTGCGPSFAIGPLNDTAMVASHLHEFEEAFINGNLLKKPTDSTFDSDINAWLERGTLGTNAA